MQTKTENVTTYQQDLQLLRKESWRVWEKNRPCKFNF